MKSITLQPKGFSLIELLVSLSIFTVVITMAVGTLLVLIDANAKAQNIQSSLTNILFSLDSMTREIRTGTSYYCNDTAPANPPSTNQVGVATVEDCRDNFNHTHISIVEGGSSLTGGGDPRIGYFYDADYDYGGGVIKGALLRRIGNESWQPLTSSQVDIQSFGLNVDGTTKGDDFQPSVILVIEGQAGELAEIDTTFTLQAYIAQRQLDI